MTRRPGSAQLPVHVVSGYLGAGKTTLVRDRLGGRWRDGTAVIINELGDVGVDGLAVLSDTPVAMVSGGCACCVRRDDLIAALTQIVVERDAGEREVRRVVIETSGVADPAPIAHTIGTHPMLRHHFRVVSVLTIVDGEHGARTLQRLPECVKQVAAADAIVVSKGDLIDASAAARLLGELAVINPAARLSLIANGEPLLLPPPTPPSRPAPIATAGEHLAGIESLSLELRAPLDWDRFTVWLTMLLHAHGEDVLRVKGTVDVLGAERVLVNSVQHVVYPPEHIPRAGGPADTRLVFILRGIESATVQRSFDVIVRQR